MKKALARFVDDLNSDFEENREWRVSMEDKLARLLDGRDGGCDMNLA